jgi:hypothetical protein
MKGLTDPRKDHYIYNIVIRAIIEASLVAWVGLVACAVASTYFLANYRPSESFYIDEPGAAVFVSYRFAQMPSV